jgi:hypothetical protein
MKHDTGDGRFAAPGGIGQSGNEIGGQSRHSPSLSHQHQSRFAISHLAIGEAAGMISGLNRVRRSLRIL